MEQQELQAKLNDEVEKKEKLRGLLAQKTKELEETQKAKDSAVSEKLALKRQLDSLKSHSGAGVKIFLLFGD